MKKRLKRSMLFLCCIASILCVLLNSCNKEILPGNFPDGYIALTFDDSSVGNWYTNLPLLDSLGIKATFYISSYHALSGTDKWRLSEMKSHGHEIAYHTTNHKNLVKLLNEKDGVDKVNEEVNGDLTLMQQDGFTLTDFAYPYGQHEASLDRNLLKTFKTVRALTNKTNFYRSLVSEACDKQVLFATDVDMSSKVSEEELYDLLSKAKEKKSCAILVAHNINNPAFRYQIGIEKLKMIARIANKLNLNFITVANIY